MTDRNPTVGERLAIVETELAALSKYVLNDLKHRVGRIEMAMWALVVGVAALLLEKVI